MPETLGLVVLEAMASGLPLVAAPAGGVRDHLRDGQNGLELARRLGRGARHTAEELTWDREMERLDRSYREICEAGISKAAA